MAEFPDSITGQSLEIMKTLVQAPPDVPIGIPQLWFGDTLHSWDIDKAEYVHTAIYFGDDQVVHVMGGCQVIESIYCLRKMTHIVGVHRPYREIWTPARKKEIVQFVNDTTGSGYDRQGAKLLDASWEQHISSVRDELDEWAKTGKVSVDDPLRSEYFCSEYVVACFIATGVISSGGPILYKPKVYSPNKVASDFMFGEPIGYVEFELT